MIRISLALTVTLAFVATSGAGAQARPDFTGKWILNYERSGRGISGNSPDVVFASQLDITQTATDLSVKRSSVRQAPFSAAYKLDGTKVNVQSPAGITETAEAKFEGASLVITYRRSFTTPAGDMVTDFKEVWTLKGNVLTVMKTVTQEGESQSESAVYEKS
jgi:hypothetical protein